MIPINSAIHYTGVQEGSTIRIDGNSLLAVVELGGNREVVPL